MKDIKNILIAAAIITALLVIAFLVFQLVLSRSIITIDNEAQILVTSLPEDWEGHYYDDNKIVETQTPNLPGVFSNGMIVKITNTEGDGLRIRANAGFDGVPLYVAYEGEAFTIIDGPQLVDSTIWWKLKSLDNPEEIGWTVHDYLEIQ